MIAMRNRLDLESVGVQLLFEGVYRWYGYDFREYADAFLRSTIRRFLGSEGEASLSALQEKVLRDPACMERLTAALATRSSKMDAGFCREFRLRVVPILRTYPFVRIWQVGCPPSEDLRSLVELLREEGLLRRTRIYVTDISERLLERSRVPVAGEPVVFAQHSLATDASLNEFQAIVCRGVLPAFGDALRERADRLFRESLVKFGILALGRGEKPADGHYERLSPRQPIFRRIR